MNKTIRNDCRLTSVLGAHQAAVDAALAELAADDVAARIWAHDHTVWKPEPDEITNRLGWLRIADSMSGEVGRMDALRESVRSAGYTHVLLLGMGGSSLAPELFSKTFGGGGNGLELAVLDSTDPGAVLAHADRLDAATTLFVVATKSGGTVETLSLFKYFYNRTSDVVGQGGAGEHFVAITDPGSKLAELAARYRFRDTFLNDPDIGGRYSALSFFGLVPAALVGAGVSGLLDRALDMAAACGPDVPVADNPAMWLGAIMGELTKAGRDKLTLVTPGALSSFGDWVEQLVAESTGKEGVGILPVVGETLGPPGSYGGDRWFAQLRLGGEGDAANDKAVAELEAAGHPVVRLDLDAALDVGGQLLLWELATAVAGRRLGINPFDQPNVEAAKVVAREMVAEYAATGALPSEEPALIDGGISVYGDVSADSAAGALASFLDQHQAGDYLVLQAYVNPSATTDLALQELRARLRRDFGLATTVGYGPRFLHSTGQLHKGDGGNGLFVQLTADSPTDAPIPDEAGADASAMTFGVLETAQAMGDRRALLDAGRRVVRFHLGTDVSAAIRRLA